MPHILSENKKETPGGAYECLVGYIKDNSIWYHRRSQGSSGLRTRIWEGTTTVTGHLKRLRNTFTTGPELKELSVYLATYYAVFILEFLKFFTSQYEEYIKTSNFSPDQSLTTVLDLTALIFE